MDNRSHDPARALAMQMFQNLARTMKPMQVLKAECEGCHRQARFNKAQATATFGPDASPIDIRDRLRCKVCGGRAQVWI